MMLIVVDGRTTGTLALHSHEERLAARVVLAEEPRFAEPPVHLGRRDRCKRQQEEEERCPIEEAVVALHRRALPYEPRVAVGDAPPVVEPVLGEALDGRLGEEGLEEQLVDLLDESDGDGVDDQLGGVVGRDEEGQLGRAGHVALEVGKDLNAVQGSTALNADLE